MVLLEIHQSQRWNVWARINEVPDDWARAGSNERVDVCLGADKEQVSCHGAIELKWPWTLPGSTRLEKRRDIVQDIARLVTILSKFPPNARFFVFGCMYGVWKRLFAEPEAVQGNEAQRVTLNALLSFDLQSPVRTVSRSALISSYSSFEERVPAALRQGHVGSLRTNLLAVQSIAVGPMNLGQVAVWQCDQISDDQTKVAADRAS